MLPFHRQLSEVEPVLSGIKAQGLEIRPFAELIEPLSWVHFATERLNRSVIDTRPTTEAL